MQQRQHRALVERRVVSAPPRGSDVPLPSQTGKNWKESAGICLQIHRRGSFVSSAAERETEVK